MQPNPDTWSKFRQYMTTEDNFHENKKLVLVDLLTEYLATSFAKETEKFSDWRVTEPLQGVYVC